MAELPSGQSKKGTTPSEDETLKDQLAQDELEDHLVNG